MSSDHTKELKRRKVSSITTFDAVELIKHSWILLLLPSKAATYPSTLRDQSNTSSSSIHFPSFSPRKEAEGPRSDFFLLFLP